MNSVLLPFHAVICRHKCVDYRHSGAAVQERDACQGPVSDYESLNHQWFESQIDMHSRLGKRARSLSPSRQKLETLCCSRTRMWFSTALGQRPLRALCRTKTSGEPRARYAYGSGHGRRDQMPTRGRAWTDNSDDCLYRDRRWYPTDYEDRHQRGRRSARFLSERSRAFFGTG